MLLKLFKIISCSTVSLRLPTIYPLESESVFCQQVGGEHLRKQHRSLAELHYSKAVSLFLHLKDAPCELLRTLLERVAFTEFAMAGERRRFETVL